MLAMAGYCMKDKGKSHYRSQSVSFTTDDLERAMRQYALVRTPYTYGDGKRMLSKRNAMAMAWKEVCRSLFRRPPLLTMHCLLRCAAVEPLPVACLARTACVADVDDSIRRVHVRPRLATRTTRRRRLPDEESYVYVETSVLSRPLHHIGRRIHFARLQHLLHVCPPCPIAH